MFLQRAPTSHIGRDRPIWSRLDIFRIEKGTRKISDVELLDLALALLRVAHLVACWAVDYIVGRQEAGEEGGA